MCRHPPCSGLVGLCKIGAESPHDAVEKPQSQGQDERRQGVQTERAPDDQAEEEREVQAVAGQEAQAEPRVPGCGLLETAVGHGGAVLHPVILLRAGQVVAGQFPHHALILAPGHHFISKLRGRTNA